MLEAFDLQADYGGDAVLHGVDVRLAVGECVALLGANGCGKTTLLKTLCGIRAASAGVVRVDGHDLATLSAPQRARRLAYVPQQHRQVFSYTVAEVVMMGRLAGRGLVARPRREDDAAVGDALRRLELQGLAQRDYLALSGGQRQQVLIARALAQDAPYLLLDEPASGLDYGNQFRLLDLLAHLRELGRGVLFTTHHPDHAYVAATRVLLMQGGRLTAEGPPAQCIDAATLQRLYGMHDRHLHLARKAQQWLRRRSAQSAI